MVGWRKRRKAAVCGASRGDANNKRAAAANESTVAFSFLAGPTQPAEASGSPAMQYLTWAVPGRMDGAGVARSVLYMRALGSRRVGAERRWAGNASFCMRSRPPGLLLLLHLGRGA